MLRKNSAKFLFVEYHGWKNYPQRLDEILSLLKTNGFKYFIDPITKLDVPFSYPGKISNSDLQLNIFAEKIPDAI